MQELPKVFANAIDKRINNTQDIYYSSDRNINTNKDSVIKKINNIFSSSNHVYKSEVRIKMNGKEIIKTIVGKTSNYLITIEGELINIIDIEDINKI